MTWFEKYWQWFFGGLAAIVAIIVGVLIRKRETPALNEARKRIEEEALQKELELEQKRDEAVAEVKKEHTEAVQELEEQLQKKTEELQKSPEEETEEYLKDVGQRMRDEKK